MICMMNFIIDIAILGSCTICSTFNVVGHRILCPIYISIALIPVSLHFTLEV